ncbi:MAG TPA: divergent polysaccharide deacetylase family protein [Rhizobiaceae bacterium]|nr:divergent polysaccharide deacetylase family protein [Rhizobiaceae bacterium]
MNDELRKPLGLKPQKPSGRPKLALAVLLVLVFATGGLLASGALFPKPPAVTAQAPASPAQPEAPAPAPSATEAEPAETDAAADPDAPALSAPEAQGEITEVQPAEPVRQEKALAHLPDPELTERVADGLLPKRGSDGRRPMDVYSRPPATEGNFGVARVVLIVGGMGISQSGSSQALKQLPPSVTLAFAPYGNSLLRWMQDARRKGHELLLQVPMEPFGFPENTPGEHTLNTAADGAANVADLHWSMSRITNYVGIINFLGGKFVTDPLALKPVFEDVAARGLLFVDDGSVRNSVTRDVATQALLPHARATIQIDTVRTRADIARQLNLLAEEAKRTGIAIGVANAFPDSIELIAKFAAAASAKGIEITPVSAIVTDPERKRQ